MKQSSLIQAPWTPGKKVLFRFVFVYFSIYILPFPLAWLPYTDWFSTVFNSLWMAPVVWTGNHIFNLANEIRVLPNGSGDTTFNYVQVFLFLVLAIVATTAWSLLDRKRPHYERLLYWLTIIIRYYLGIVALTYGFAKVIKTQFPFPPMTWLMESYGDSSPMRLLWTFMGYSAVYNVFTGMGEVLGGLLLFFRRTKMVGSLILAAVMSNVVLINFAYDVPVKLFSSHLLLMLFFLLAPDVANLWKFLVLRQAVEAAVSQPVFVQKKWKSILLTAKLVFIVGLIVVHVFNGLSMIRTKKDLPVAAGLEAVYDVDTFVLKNDTLPPLMNDKRRWKRILIDQGGMSNVEYMDGAVIWYRYDQDTVKHTIALTTPGSKTGYHFSYDLSGSAGHEVWRGAWSDSDSLQLTVARSSMKDFPLVSRGFHWINEYPFNR